MATREETTYICDCCQKESDQKDFNDGNRGGSFTIDISGTQSGIGLDGAWGGVSHKLNLKNVCLDCGTLILESINKISSEKSKTIVR